MKRPEAMKVGLDKRSFWSKSFVPFCLAGRVCYAPAVPRAQLAGWTVVEESSPAAEDILRIWREISPVEGRHGIP